MAEFYRLFVCLFVWQNAHGKALPDSSKEEHNYAAVTCSHVLPSYVYKNQALSSSTIFWGGGGGRVYMVLLDHTQHVHGHG